MTAVSSPVRVVVVDDHPVFRMGMVALLSTLDGISCVGEADGAATGAAVIAEHRPDVVLMDLRLGDGSGVVATRAAVQADPQLGVLVVTMLDDDDSVFAALRAGARGYVLKTASPTEIERAVHAVADGEVLLGRGVAARAVRLLSPAAHRAPAAFPQLTERELEILDLVAAGLDNTAVARRLALSTKTVRNHLSRVLTKIRAPDRGQAIIRAREAGLGGP
ncbi:response regulator transcription factor [Dactylosporangium maewongense]|uniref:Response regulator transcription factor n=1 Tax=Dactylosporangium maewongense TaxID=634393 RepID=A0ABN2CHH8_9ACTN